MPTAKPKARSGQPPEPGGKAPAQAPDRHLALQTQHQVLSQPGEWSGGEREEKRTNISLSQVSLSYATAKDGTKHMVSVYLGENQR